LDDALRFLTAGSRTAPSRHRTLRAAIEWSHDLLTDREQIMLRRLSVFAGGFTLDAVDDVCAVPPLDDADVVDILTRLVDTSLLAVGGPEPRYEMRTTIRLYAAERLGESGEEEAARSRHAGFFRRLVRGGGAALAPAEQAEWLAQLDADHDDLAAAIHWAIDRGDAVLAVGLAGDLGRFWYRRGYYGEASKRLREVLSMPDLAPSEDLANVLRFAAAMVMSTGDTAGAIELTDRAEAVAGEVGIPVLMARCHNLRGGIAWRTGDYREAAARYREAIGLLKEDDPFLVRLYVNLAGVLTGSGALEEAEAALLAVERSPALESRDVVVGISTRGWLEYARGDLDSAVGTFAEAVAVMRELGLKPDLAWALKLAAQVSVASGDLGSAEDLATESLVLHTEIDDIFNAAEADQILAEIAVARGDVAGAADTMARVLRLFRDTGRCAEAVETLAGFIAVAVAAGDWPAAARLLGARARALDDLGIVPPAPRRMQQAAWEHAAAEGLGEAAFAAERAAGASLGLAEATTYALSTSP
jgi:tetratricopeptide (TPR) repeat protein